MGLLAINSWLSAVMKLKRSQQHEQREFNGEMEQRTRAQQNQNYYDHRNMTFTMRRPSTEDQTSVSQYSSTHSVYAPACDGQSQQDQYQQHQMYTPSGAVPKQKRKPVGVAQRTEIYDHDRHRSTGLRDDMQEINSRPTMDALPTNSRRKKRRSSRYKHNNEHAIRSRSSFSTEAELAYLTPRLDLWSWRDCLPQSMDDTTIVDRVQKVFVLAEQYVNNFYVDCQGQQAQAVPLFEREGLSHLLEDIKTENLMYSVAHPTILIKHSLIASLLNVISLETQDRWTSLLPAEFLSMTRAIRQSDLAETESLHWNAVLSAHRVLSHYIRKNVTQEPSYLKLRNESIDDIAADIEIAFAPWTCEERTIHQRGPILCALFAQAADLGIALFSQASTFHFSWRLKPTKSSAVEIAIAPRLYKLYDENAQLIDNPQQMVQMKVERTVKESYTPEPPTLPRTPSPNHTDRNILPLREARPRTATEGGRQDVAELPAESTSVNGLNKHDSARGPHDPLATIPGPSLNEPDYENANGEGLSLATPSTLCDEVAVSQFYNSRSHEILGNSRRKRSASIGDLCVDTLPYVQHKLNEFAASSQERILLSQKSPIDNSSYTAPAAPAHGHTRRKMLPPTSFPTHFVENPPVRRESLDRGRNTSRSSFLRNRSRSESRAMNGSSYLQQPLAEPGGTNFPSFQASLNNPSEQYAELRAAHNRAREDRDSAAIIQLPVPDGLPCITNFGPGPEKVTDVSASWHSTTNHEQIQEPVMSPNIQKALTPQEMPRAQSKTQQGSTVSGWFRGVGKTMLGNFKSDPNRYQQRVMPF